MPGTSQVAPFACYRCPYGHDVDDDGQPDLNACKLACANMVDYVLEREGDVAAVIAEPVRAVPYLPPPGFWRAVREACDRRGALLIFDEIPTGLGKTGSMFSCEEEGVTPDILVLGKALGGGILPIAAVVARPELDVGGDWAFGHYTHEKNPVTARAALTTIEIIEQEGLVENARRVGEMRPDPPRGDETAPAGYRRRAGQGAPDRHRTGRGPGDQGARTRRWPNACSIARWIAACPSRRRWATCSP
jgi:4-aminobutyrate aminotransferase